MKRALAILVMTMCCAAAALAGDFADNPTAPQGRPVPYQVIPVEAFSATIKNWADPDMPHYAIMGHVGEWNLAFQPTPTAGDKRPFNPQAAVFEKALLVAISRVSDAPGPGQKVLVVKSLLLNEGQLILTYGFIPPQRQGAHKVKNTIIVAIPIQFQNYDLRIVEDTETPESLAAQRELEEAIREGRYKPQPMEPQR